MNVWMLEVFEDSVPTVTEYELVRASRRSVTVLLEGRTILLQARPGRHFHTAYLELEAHYRRELERVAENAANRLALLKRKLRAGMTIARPNLRFSLNVDRYRLRR